MILPSRSGALAPSHCPTMPPIDRPHQCTLSMLRSSRIAMTSRPKRSIDIRAGRDVRFAVAAPVVADDAKQLRQRSHLRLPHLQGGAQRVRQHQRRPAIAAFDGDVEQAPIRIDHRHVMSPPGFVPAFRMSCPVPAKAFHELRNFTNFGKSHWYRSDNRIPSPPRGWARVAVSAAGSASPGAPAQARCQLPCCQAGCQAGCIAIMRGG